MPGSFRFAEDAEASRLLAAEVDDFAEVAVLCEQKRAGKGGD